MTLRTISALAGFVTAIIYARSEKPSKVLIAAICGASAWNLVESLTSGGETCDR